LRQLVDRLPEGARRRALTHSSWVEHRSLSYERLEFLGDSVLGLAIARHLYDRFPQRPEGDLARIRAHVVSRESCAQVGRDLELTPQLLERSAELGAEPLAAAQIATSDSVLAQVVEAVIGAALLEFGHDVTADAVVDAFAGRVEYALGEHVDHKTVLQEELARRGRTVTYSLVETIGPDHDRRFTSAAVAEGRELGRGSGPSKKASEQAAAREALRMLSEGRPVAGEEGREGCT
jgi:ribonuclease-3